MQIKNFEDLEIWKESRRLTRDVYDLSKASTFFKDFGLGDQMRRAAVSIMSNIAEGFERGGNQEFIQHLYIAKGSCGEIRSQLYVALDQKCLEQNKAESLMIILKRLSVMIKHLIDHLKRSGCVDRSTVARINCVHPMRLDDWNYWNDWNIWNDFSKLFRTT